MSWGGNTSKALRVVKNIIKRKGQLPYLMVLLNVYNFNFSTFNSFLPWLGLAEFQERFSH